MTARQLLDSSTEVTMRQKLFDADQAGEILQCSASWLKRQAKLRRIPFTMIGGQYRFSESHLDRIVRIFEQQPQDSVQRQSSPRRRPRPVQPEEVGVVTLTARRPRRQRSA